MWCSDDIFKKFMPFDEDNDVYKNLESDNPSNIVMKLYEKIKLETFYETKPGKKSEYKSDASRRQGNDALKSDSYYQALMFYNMALSYAPNGSRSLKLAYSNRSALLYKLEEYKYALKDIEMCYQLGCPADLVQKLKVREEKCHQLKKAKGNMEKGVKIIISSADALFLGPYDNCEIPCASSAVKLDTSGPHPKVIAAENIDVGAVLALETAFVNTPNSHEDAYLICYHCMKSTFNLIPCNNCCLVMFCDENCKSVAINEYHAIECKLLDKMYIGNINLTLKAVIKLKNEYADWSGFIEVCNKTVNANKTNRNLKRDRPFSHANPNSLLHNTTDTYVPFGKKFTRAAITAELLRKLEETGSFFPKAQNEKLLAMHATAKLIMHLFLYSREVTLKQNACVSPKKNLEFTAYYTHSFYIFLSKFEHSCHPNLIVAAMNNKAALIAVQPISRGAPLTVSYIDYIQDFPTRELYIYFILGSICSYIERNEKRGKNLKKNYKLSMAQKKYIEENDLDNLKVMALLRGIEFTYQNICLGLKLFSNLPSLRKFLELLLQFKNCYVMPKQKTRVCLINSCILMFRQILYLYSANALFFHRNIISVTGVYKMQSPIS